MSTTGLTHRRRPAQQTERTEPEPERVLAALSDDDCRAILAALADGPRTASELGTRCDIPQSTLYRKLEELTATGLVGEGLRIGSDGHHASEYHRNAQQIEVTLGDSVAVSLAEDAKA